MADDDLVYRWPQPDLDTADASAGGSILPAWNSQGVLGGVAELNPPINSLDMLMTPEEQKTIAPLDGDEGGIDGMPGVRPSGWGDDDTLPTISLGEGATPDLGSAVVVQPGGDNSGDGTGSAAGTPVGPVAGYPETGKNNWRAGLDDQITSSADQFNTDNGYRPGDPLYMTPQTLKSMDHGGERWQPKSIRIRSAAGQQTGRLAKRQQQGGCWADQGSADDTAG